MTNAFWLPPPPDITNDPELAILAALDAVLQVTACALFAQYPDLYDEVPGHDPHRLGALSASIIDSADGLRRFISDYRVAIERRYSDRTF